MRVVIVSFNSAFILTVVPTLAYCASSIEGLKNDDLLNDFHDQFNFKWT